MDKKRRLDRRQQADAESLARLPLASLDGQDWFVGKVVAGGTVPTAVPRYYLVKPQAISGEEAEGTVLALADAFGADAPKVPVVVLGPSAPVAGDRLVVKRAGARWVAEFGPSPSPPPPPGDRVICATVKVCLTGEPDSGETVTVTGPGGFSATCTTATATGECCIVVPEDGTYTVSATVGGSTASASVVIVGPGVRRVTLCVGGGLAACFRVMRCGLEEQAGQVVEFLQGGVVVATGTSDAQGKVCVCLPARVDTTLRANSVPPRFQATTLFVPRRVLPVMGCGGPTGVIGDFTGGLCGESGYQSCLFFLKPASGYGCMPCFEVERDWYGGTPISDVLQTVDPVTGNAVALHRSGMGWVGTDTASFGPCADPYGLGGVCPAATVPMRYGIYPDPTLHGCAFTVSALYHWRRVTDALGLTHDRLCPGAGPDPAIFPPMPDVWVSGYARLFTVSDPPAYVGTSTILHPLTCGDPTHPIDNGRPTVGYTVTE